MEKLNLSSKTVAREESRLRAFLWPNLKAQPGIEGVIDIGKVVAYAVAGITCLTVILRMIPAAALVDAGLFAAFGFGIGRKSRICASLALVLYLANQILGRTWNIVLVLCIAFIFINSIRGTVAYHRIKASTSI